MADFADSLHGDLGDRYVVERELGHGATATVYLARDAKFDRLVAVKVLSPDLALAVPTERFLREIRTTAQLSHPHIVPLFDSGSVGGRPFYVMPFVRGEALRDRLAREGALPVPEALRIARQVAGALDHAHRHGVIHRDIKPGNILLEDGHAWVADFGIARAMALTDSQTVTNTGVSVGTPAYMSPEQAMGESKLDARTDVYSLGCVLYEMLTGALPFTGPDVQSVLHKHLVEELPSVRTIRPDVPEQVERLLEVALAKKRADRFATAAEFAQALSLEGAGPLTPTQTQPGRRWRRVGVRPWAASGVGGALVVGAVVLIWKVAFGGDRALDPAAYFVVPFAHAEGVPDALDAGRLFQDALNEWSGIRVLGRFEAPAGQGPPSAVEARRLARENGAGHYLRGEVAPVGDLIRVRAALYSTSDGSLVRERVINVAAALGDADSLFATLADRVLFEDTVVAANGGRAGTRSFAARAAFARGLAAVQEWELAEADSQFVSARQEDPGYTQAHLWIAQVRYWGAAPIATWQSSAERAASQSGWLSSRDRMLSNALVAVGRGEIVRACSEWDQLTRRETSDFAGWYGLANCLKGDDVVIRDRLSPSGWRYRSSYYRALKAYQRAFQLMPAIHKALRSGGYQSVRFLLMTSSVRRAGRALPPDTLTYRAWAVWQADSLALVPFPAGNLPENRPSAIRGRTVTALRHQRELFHEIATSWVAAFPTHAGALESLALSLEMLGEPSSLDTLRRARALEPDPHDRLRLAATEVWVQLKFAIPSDLSGIRTARNLADSILRDGRSSSAAEARLFSSLAALTGKARLAGALSREAASDLGAPGPIAHGAPPLVVYAALGGPEDTLRDLEQDVEARIENVLPPSEREAARMAWLARAAQLAFPDHQLRSLTRLAGRGDDLVDAQSAYLRGDTTTVLAVFAAFRRVREQFPPAHLTLDVLHPEAALLAAMGDERAAIAWLDPTLNSLSGTAPLVFNDPARAAGLVRAMALRAELAHRTGDPAAAARWARAVAILWSDADPFLQPIVKQMHRLAK